MKGFRLFSRRLVANVLLCAFALVATTAHASDTDGALGCPKIVGFLPVGGEEPTDEMEIPNDLHQIGGNLFAYFLHEGIKPAKSKSPSVPVSFVTLNTNGTPVVLPHQIDGDLLILPADAKLAPGDYDLMLSVTTLAKINGRWHSCMSGFELAVRVENSASGVQIPYVASLSPNNFAPVKPERVTLTGGYFTSNTRLFAMIQGKVVEYPLSILADNEATFMVPANEGDISAELYLTNDGKKFSDPVTLTLLGAGDPPPLPGGATLGEVYVAPAILTGDAPAARPDPQHVTFGLPFPSKQYAGAHPGLSALIPDASTNTLPISVVDNAGNPVPFQSRVTRMHTDGSSVEWAAITALLGPTAAGETRTLRVVSGGEGSWGGAPLLTQDAGTISLNSGYYLGTFSKQSGAFNPLLSLSRNGEVLSQRLGLELFADGSALGVVTRSVAVLRNGPVAATIQVMVDVTGSGGAVIMKGDLRLSFVRNSPHIAASLTLFPQNQQNLQIDSGSLFFDGRLGSSVLVRYPTSSPGQEISLALSGSALSELRIEGNTKPIGWDLPQTWSPVQAICSGANCTQKFNFQGMVVTQNGTVKYADSAAEAAPMHVYGVAEGDGKRLLVHNQNGRVRWATGVALRGIANGVTRAESMLFGRGYPTKHVIAHNDVSHHEVTFSFLDGSYASAPAFSIAAGLDRPYFGVPADIETLNFAESTGALFANDATEAKVLGKLGISSNFPASGLPYAKDVFHYDSGNGGGDNNQNTGLNLYILCVTERKMGNCLNSERWIDYRIQYRTLWKLGPALNPAVKAKYDVEELAHTHLLEQFFHVYTNPDHPLAEAAFARHRDFLMATLSGNVNKYTRPLVNAVSAAAVIARFFADQSILDEGKNSWTAQLLFESHDGFNGKYGWFTKIGQSVDGALVGNTYLEPPGSSDCPSFAAKNPGVDCAYSSRGFMSGWMLGNALEWLAVAYNGDPYGAAANVRLQQAAEYMLYHGINFDTQNPANTILGYLLINKPSTPFIATYPSAPDHPTTKLFAAAYLMTGDERFVQALKQELQGFEARGQLKLIRHKDLYRHAIKALEEVL